jgi:hypothetical protein
MAELTFAIACARSFASINSTGIWASPTRRNSNETEPWENIYFKPRQRQTLVVERATEAAALIKRQADRVGQDPSAFSK